MTPSELKFHVEQTRSDSYYFSKDTLNFFGDTMKNYGVRSAGKYWELYRKRPVKNGLQASAYFDKKTFKQVYSTELKAEGVLI